jgi:hypothetical protein
MVTRADFGLIEARGILKRGWMSDSYSIADWGMSDAKAVFCGFAGACRCGGRGWGVSPRGGRAICVSAASAVRWVQRRRQTGQAAAKRRRSKPPALEEQAGLLLALIAAEPDLTLDEVGARLREQDISTSRSAIWRSPSARGLCEVI